MPNKIIHIITGLNDGGAEAVLYRLCTASNVKDQIVVSLMDEGKYGPLLRDAGIFVECLHMPKRCISIDGLLKLWKLIRKEQPEVVQTWMYHANLVGGILSRLAGISNVNWGIHHTTLDPCQSPRSTIFVAKMCAMISRIVPRRIICCSESSLKVHRQQGYPDGKLVFIPNGYNVNEFAPDVTARMRIRKELGLTEETPLVGMVARFDPQKDHKNLLLALGVIKRRGQNFKCALVGTNIDWQNSELLQEIEANDLTDRVLLLGRRDDIPAVMNALDIHVLSSFGEAFPNVLCEAMACGTPCVTTDVGDAAFIVGGTGWVCPPKSPALLGQKISEAIESWSHFDLWKKRQIQARNRVSMKFSISRMSKAYEEVWAFCHKGTSRNTVKR